MTTPPPIACTLGKADYADRLRWIAALNRDALRSHRWEHLTLELHYDPTAAEGVRERVRELVRREQQCCAFLAFEVRETADAVVVRITAPPQTRAAIDAVFEPFVRLVRPASRR